MFSTVIAFVFIFICIYLLIIINSKNKEINKLEITMKENKGILVEESKIIGINKSDFSFSKEEYKYYLSKNGIMTHILSDKDLNLNLDDEVYLVLFKK